MSGSDISADIHDSAERKYMMARQYARQDIKWHMIAKIKIDADI